MVVALMTMGGLGLHGTPSLAASRGIVAMVFLYMFSFSLGWGPTVWVVCSEIATGRNRNKLMTMSTSVNWLFNWLVSFVFPYLFDADAANLQTRVGFIYGSLTVAALVWLFWLLPEPAGRSLEEIDRLFELHVPARKFGGFCSLMCLGNVSFTESHHANLEQRRRSWTWAQLSSRRSSRSTETRPCRYEKKNAKEKTEWALRHTRIYSASFLRVTKCRCPTLARARNIMEVFEWYCGMHAQIRIKDIVMYYSKIL